MADVVYVSKIHLKRIKGPLRTAQLPGESESVRFSVHDEIAKHYGVDETKLGEKHAATIDYVVAATGGWMLGTFGGALEARKIDASGGRLTADVRGEIENEDGVLVIRRIHVEFTLHAPDDVRETVERVHGFYADKCPVYRSLRAAIQITSSYLLVGPASQLPS